MPYRLNLCNFVHVPKTGGMWILSHFPNKIPFGEEHDPVTNSLLPSFAFVRNPVTWYQSRWGEFHNSPYEKVRWVNSKKTSLTSDESFGNWLDRINVREKHVTNIYENLLGQNLSKINFIGKFEFLQEDLKRILLALGEPLPTFKERKINASVKDNKYPTMKHIERVISAEKQIMEFFGYSTNPKDYLNLCSAILFL